MTIKRRLEALERLLMPAPPEVLRCVAVFPDGARPYAFSPKPGCPDVPPCGRDFVDIEFCRRCRLVSEDNKLLASYHLETVSSPDGPNGWTCRASIIKDINGKIISFTGCELLPREAKWRTELADRPPDCVGCKIKGRSMLRYTVLTRRPSVHE